MPSTLPNWTTVGFTGHRRLADPRLVADAIQKVFDDLSATHGLLAAVSSAASGADTLFVEEVARRKLPYFLIFPFDRERFRGDFSQAEWDRVAAHFPGALSIDEVRDVDSPQEGYLEGGILTVDRCDVLLAVWDGEEAAGKGGTGDIVKYARALDLPLIRIDPANGNITKERMDQLPTGAPSQSATTDAALPPRKIVERQYDEWDRTALATAPTARRLLLQVIWLHLLATAVGVTGSALELPGFVGQSFNAFKFAALGFALLLTYQQRKSHHQWRDARVVAEFCRSYLSFWSMRRRGAHFPRMHAEKYATLVRNLQMYWYLDRAAELPLEKASERYKKDRIDDQLKYFDNKYKADGRRAKRLKVIALCTTIAAFVTSGVALGLNLGEFSTPAYTISVARWISNILGLIPPAILTLVIGLDLGRRATRFSDATDNLREAERRLDLAHTWPSLWRVVSSTEELLIREVLEWNAQSDLKTKS